MISFLHITYGMISKVLGLLRTVHGGLDNTGTDTALGIDRAKP
jgi:hypothetical protein